ncbi:hypothetical protein Hanom_Chr11g01044781 [Helianthus anomalus]
MIIKATRLNITLIIYLISQLPLDPAVVASAVNVVDYISSENLKPVSDQVVKFKSLMEGLESKDWLKICDSLNDVSQRTG